MATMKKAAPKAQLGKLVKKGLKVATSASASGAPKKVVIPPGLQKSLNKSKSGPTKITDYSSEAERMAAGKQSFLQKKPYAERDYDKPSYLEREVKPKSKSKTKRDEYGFDERPDRNGGTHKKKMRNGGSLSGLKASTKRVGPVDPKGAFTKVQKKTLAGAKGKATLTKDKQLGATKMAKRGMSIKKK
jgi:hypothetical protein